MKFSFWKCGAKNTTATAASGSIILRTLLVRVREKSNRALVECSRISTAMSVGTLFKFRPYGVRHFFFN